MRFTVRLVWSGEMKIVHHRQSHLTKFCLRVWTSHHVDRSDSMLQDLSGLEFFPSSGNVLLFSRRFINSRVISGVSKFGAACDRGISGRQYESRRSDELTSQNATVEVTG